MLIARFLNLPKQHSFFLFGARGTGKSTLIKEVFSKQVLMLNLLDPELEARFLRSPGELEQVVKATGPKIRFIVIDEIQKVPKLLDLVHHLIESTDKIFVLTGSSARKLKQGGANLLAGRAFVYNLHPFSCF